MKKFFTSLLVMAMTIVACTPENIEYNGGDNKEPGGGDPEPGDSTIVEDGYIKGSSEPIFLKFSEQSSAQLKQQFGGKWTMTTETEWIALSPENGEKGSADIVVTAKTANDEYCERVGEITAKTSTEEKKWWIIQRGPLGFKIIDNSTSYTGSNEIVVKTIAHSTIDFSLSSEENNWAEIIKVEKSGNFAPIGDTGYRSSYCETDITIALNANTNTEERTASFKLVGGENEYEITITQPAADYKAFYKRSVAYRFTATWCSNCPMMAKAIEAVSEEYPDRLIPMNLYSDDGKSDPELAFKDFGYFKSLYNINAYPTGVFNGFAIVNNISTAINTEMFSGLVEESYKYYPATCGIAARSSLSDDMVTVDIDVITMENKQYALSAFIVEDNVAAPQAGVSDGNYKHKYVTRAALHKTSGGDSFTSVPGEISSISLSCNLDSKINKDNAYIVIYVTSNEKVNEGRVDKVDYGNYGSVIDNAVKVSLNGSVELKYE